MDTMQSELDAAYPALRIQLLGVNQRGQEPGNASTTAGRDLPWLQDVDENGNSAGDVADDLWDVTFRDVVILDGENEQVGVFNLSANDLGDTEHYNTLREMLVDAAMLSQLPWMNADDPLDVDDNGNVVPLDVLLVVNELVDQGNHKLPPPTSAELSAPYFDANGDGNLTPLDPLQIINFLNSDQNQPEAEAQPATSERTARQDQQAQAGPAISLASSAISLDSTAAGDDETELPVRDLVPDPEAPDAGVPDAGSPDAGSPDSMDTGQDERESDRWEPDPALGLDYFRLPISATKASSSGN
jgi:hypothetical protein